jgi:hypothetical protein
MLLTGDIIDCPTAVQRGPRQSCRPAEHTRRGRERSRRRRSSKVIGRGLDRQADVLKADRKWDSTAPSSSSRGDGVQLMAEDVGEGIDAFMQSARRSGRAK